MKLSQNITLSNSNICWYSSSIRMVANVAMIINIVIYLYNFLMTLYGSTSNNIFYTIFIGFIVTFGIVICVLVIYGGKSMKSWAFIPYLVMTGIGITFILALSLVLFAHSLFQKQDLAFKNIEDGFNGIKLFKNKDEGKITEYTAKLACMSITLNVFCMSVVGLLLSSLLPIGFWIIVFQAYRYVKNKSLNSPPPVYDAIEVLDKTLNW